MNLNHPNYQRDKFRDARLQNNLLVLKSLELPVLRKNEECPLEGSRRNFSYFMTRIIRY